MRVRYVVFDLGGVLVKSSENAVLRELSSRSGRALPLLREAVERYRRGVTTGGKTLLEMYDNVKRDLQVDTLDAAQMLNIHLEIHRSCSIEPDQHLLHLVTQLKTDYLVACLTNTEPEIHSMNKEHGLYTHFHRAFVSVELGMAKPDREIFERVLSDLHATPGEVVFIDDKEPNIDSASQLGIRSVQFYTAERLRLDLTPLLA